MKVNVDIAWKRFEREIFWLWVLRDLGPIKNNKSIVYSIKKVKWKTKKIFHSWNIKEPAKYDAISANLMFSGNAWECAHIVQTAKKWNENEK